MKSIFLLIFVLIMLLTSCAPAPQPEVPVEKEPVVGESQDFVITMEISGGIAGISEKYTVFSDGRIVSNQGKEANIDPENAADLFATIQELNFFDMQDDYTAFSTCRDCFTYIITVQNGDRVKSVRAEEGTAGSPQGYWFIVRELSGLMTALK
jgi:hypothetical protein